MERVVFCRGCGKLINALWLYCPFCGSPVWKGGSFEAAVEEPFAELEKKTGTGLEERFARMERDLDALERDLDTIIDSSIDGGNAENKKNG
jgi:hypothetical protein